MADNSNNGKQPQLPMVRAGVEAHYARLDLSSGFMEGMKARQELRKIQACIENGEDPFIADKDKLRTVLHSACRYGGNELFKMLRDYAIKHEEVLDFPDKKGMTPFLVACRYGRKEIVDEFLATIPDRPSHRKLIFDLDKQDVDGWTALMYAAAFNNYEIFANLLENKADVNKQTTTGDTILTKAVVWGEEKTVQILLGHGAEVDTEDNDGDTPLILAAINGYNNIIERLLRNKAKIDKKNKMGETALMGAIKFGYVSTVKLLLKKGADATISNVEKKTSLMLASKEGLEDIVKLLLDQLSPQTCTAIDDEGKTALHVASESEPTGNISDTSKAGQYVETMRRLLTVQGILDMNTKEGETALHLATRANKPDRVEILLGKMTRQKINLKNQEGHTALEVAVQYHYREIILKLLQQDADLEEESHIKEEALTWAIENENNHDIAKILIEQRNSTPEKSAEIRKRKDWDVLELAVYCEDLSAVWQLLQVIAPADRDGKRIERAKQMVEEGIQNHKIRPTRRASEVPRKESPNRQNKRETKDPTLPYYIMKRLLDDIDSYLGTSTSITKLRRPQQTLRDTRLSTTESNVMITDFYNIGDLLSLQRESTSVSEVIYGLGPEKIMNDKERRRAHIKREVDKIKQDFKAPMLKGIRSRRTGLKATETSNESTRQFRFRWIHLPNNNIQWMNDLTTKIFFERTQKEMVQRDEQDNAEQNTRAPNEYSYEEEFGRVNAFVGRSWCQTPDSNSPSRFMKPQCMKIDMNTRDGRCNTTATTLDGQGMRQEQTANNITTESNGNQNFKHVALYMPYITFGIQAKGDATQMSPKQDNLIHYPSTLDEFYYQFNSDSNYDPEHVKSRNMDQIITKWLYNDNCQNLKSWILLKVDQLWLWIVDSDTIITSCTKYGDGGHDVIYREVLAQMQNAGRQPNSTYQLAELIVKACIHTYDRVPLGKGNDEIQAFKTQRTGQEYAPLNNEHLSSLTIHEIFSNSINQSAVEETNLFMKFTGSEETEKDPSNYVEAIKMPANLLCKVKDLRDELHILHTLVSYQQGVLEELCPKRPYKIPKAATRILQKIEEMDRYVERLYDAVNATLTLRQNKLAIQHSKEAVNQGKILMIFTIATVFFLPLSFLTSLFALNVSSFQHNAQGDLFYSPRWIFPLIFCTSLAVSGPLILYAFHSKISDYWKIWDFFIIFCQKTWCSFIACFRDILVFPMAVYTYLYMNRGNNIRRWRNRNDGHGSDLEQGTTSGSASKPSRARHRSISDRFGDRSRT
ncbi:ankyrin repeat-containing domain protein [Camillea tinctor]|nr:ankyrin repeat-containing domain protein [Camillea tinctor]